VSKYRNVLGENVAQASNKKHWVPFV